MNSEWSLDSLYLGFDTENYQKDEARLDTLIQEYTDLAKHPAGTPAEVLRAMILNEQETSSLVTKLFSYAELRTTVNTSDADATAVCGRLHMKLSALAVPSTLFTEYVAGIEDLADVIASDALLTEHAFYLHNLKEKKRFTLSADVENVISLYEISGSSAWGDLQSYLTSTVPVEYKGETTTLSDIRNKAYDADPTVRKEAYEAELKSYERIKDGIAFALNSIKLEVINRCKLRGFESPLQETLHQAHMKRETLDALIGAMEEYLPKFWEYLQAKAKLLGHEGGLPFYDLFAPLKGNDRRFTTEESKEYLVNLFNTFDKEEADMIARAFDESWIDFYPHAGKVGGAFCSDIHPLKESRILTNFDGALGDVVTLAHELGHAFHNHCLRNNSILNTDVSMPVAESASTFNEVVCMNAAIAQESDPIARRALIESQLMDATQIICDIYSRYLFETAVFENREDGFLFPEKLCEIMLDAQKKAYGTGLDQEKLHPFMWACKGHYYSGGLSFYNFPYAFGGLFARGLYAKYLTDGESFVPLYKKLLAATGYNTVEDAALIAGIDLTDKAFWRSSLQILADEVDEFVKLCKE